MNPVVAGGAGFIGSSLVRKLLEIGCSVVVADDLSGGKAATPIGVAFGGFETLAPQTALVVLAHT